MTETDPNMLLIVYGALAVPSYYMLGWHRLLPGGTHYRLGFLILLVAFAGIAVYSRSRPDIDSKSVAASAAPLVAFWIYAALRWFFAKRMGRPPIDVAFNWKSGLFYDRVFAMVTVMGLVFGTMGCFVLLGIIVP